VRKDKGHAGVSGVKVKVKGHHAATYNTMMQRASSSSTRNKTQTG
jgi:hypothetical protein